METVTRSEGQPTDATPAAAETEERYISGRPDWTIERISISRTRPPAPAAICIHPAAIVIRSPAPRVRRNPGPTPIRLIHPTPIAIGSPVRRFVWTPHLTVLRNFRPGAVRIQIFRPN